MISQNKLNWFGAIILSVALILLVSSLFRETSSKPLTVKSNSQHSVEQNVTSIFSQADFNITPTQLPLGGEAKLAPNEKPLEILKNIILKTILNPIAAIKNQALPTKNLPVTEKESTNNQKEQTIQTTILSSHVINPDCYREGGPGPLGINVVAPCCNCGLGGSDCDAPIDDCGENGELCCEQLGCLNKYCIGKPAIWDPESGECGC